MKGSTLLWIIMSVLLSYTLYLSYENSKQIKALQQENAELLARVDNTEQTDVEQPGSQEETPAASSRVVGEVEVTSKYRLEDRYVSYKVMNPDYLGQEVGEVVLNISVDWTGEVKSAKLQKATGITDEDVIEACKKAALKTHFNSNFSGSTHKNLSGTITYIFTEKLQSRRGKR